MSFVNRSNVRIGFCLLLFIAPVSSLYMPFSITKANDGYVIAGVIYSYPKDHYFLIKINPYGEEIWKRSYSDHYETQAWTVAKVSDGYFIGGVIREMSDMDKGWIIKLDEKGNPLWQKKFGYPACIAGIPTLLADGNDVVLAITMPQYSNCINENVWIAKLDKNGNEVWKREFDFRIYDSIKMMKKTQDGGFVAVGSVGDYAEERYTNYDILIMKLDSQGNKVWVSFLDLGFDEVAWDVAEFEGGYIVVGGSIDDFNNCCFSKINIAKAFALKFDSNGSLEWNKFFEVGNITIGWSVVCGDKPIIAGTAIDEKGSYIWLSPINASNVIIKRNFTFLTAIYGPIRMIGADDGYILTASGCDGNCVWLGKLDREYKLLWERNYFPKRADIENVSKPETAKLIDDKISSSNGWTLGQELLYALVLLIIALILAFVIYRIQ